MFNALNFSLDMIWSGAAGGCANSTVTCSNLAILTCPSENRNTPQYQFANGQSFTADDQLRGQLRRSRASISLMSGTIIPANNCMIGTAMQSSERLRRV